MQEYMTDYYQQQQNSNDGGFTGEGDGQTASAYGAGNSFDASVFGARFGGLGGLGMNPAAPLQAHEPSAGAVAPNNGFGGMGSAPGGGVVGNSLEDIIRRSNTDQAPESPTPYGLAGLKSPAGADKPSGGNASTSGARSPSGFDRGLQGGNAPGVAPTSAVGRGAGRSARAFPAQTKKSSGRPKNNVRGGKVGGRGARGGNRRGVGRGNVGRGGARMNNGRGGGANGVAHKSPRAGGLENSRAGANSAPPGLLLVSGVHPKINRKIFRKKFGVYGPIVAVRFKPAQKTATVQFENVEDATKARNFWHGKYVKGMQLQVHFQNA